MTHRIHTSLAPTDPRPWPEVFDISRVYDHGQPWCINADGHPPRDGGYPDPQLHVPANECQSLGLYLHDLRFGLDGEEWDLEVYAAHPFRFGQSRTTTTRRATRIVLEFSAAEDDAQTTRYSLSLGAALRLAAHLDRLVELVDGYRLWGAG